MRIALVSTAGTPVRRRGAGSIESIVWLLSHELTVLGHDVTVFGIKGSQVEGNLEVTLPGAYGDQGSPDNWHLCEWICVCRAVEMSGEFDVIHSHNYLYGVPLEKLARTPMVHTLHIMADDDAFRLRRCHPTSCVTAISKYQWQNYSGDDPLKIILHGIDVSQFTFREHPQEYLLYLGRFTPGKGPLEAVNVARSAGLKLILAGPRNDYFDKHVAPLVDGVSIEYAGPVGGARRDELLGGARALLYPLREAEPFGLVMPEAMMCGTPVVAVRIGAVPEIVEDGVTGCLASDPADLPKALGRAILLDRAKIRLQAEKRFASRRMTEDYLSLYERLINR